MQNKHKIFNHINQYWTKHMKKQNDAQNDPRVPGVKTNDNLDRKPTAREIMLEIDVEQLADKYLQDGITIVVEDRNHDIITMYGPNMMDDYDEAGNILRRDFDKNGNLVDENGNIIEKRDNDHGKE